MWSITKYRRVPNTPTLSKKFNVAAENYGWNCIVISGEDGRWVLIDPLRISPADYLSGGVRYRCMKEKHAGSTLDP